LFGATREVLGGRQKVEGRLRATGDVDQFMYDTSSVGDITMATASTVLAAGGDSPPAYLQGGALKKVLLAAALAAAIAVPTALAAPTAKLTGNGGSPGAVYNGNHPFTVSVTAQGTAPNATGSFTFTRADGSFGGSVDCYIQSGNEAWASGHISQAAGVFGYSVGQGFVVGVQDNGQGAGDPADKIQVDIQPYSAGLCSTYSQGVSGWFPYDVTSGNFQVH
jgi:hypothetical protein